MKENNRTVINHNHSTKLCNSQFLRLSHFVGKHLLIYFFSPENPHLPTEIWLGLFPETSLQFLFLKHSGFVVVFFLCFLRVQRYMLLFSSLVSLLTSRSSF